MGKDRTVVTIVAVVLLSLGMFIVPALIGVPIVEDVLSDMDSSYNKSDVNMFISNLEIEKFVAINTYDTDFINAMNNGENMYSFGDTTGLPSVGYAYFDEDGNISVAIELDGHCYSKGFLDESLIETKLEKNEECIIK